MTVLILLVIGFLLFHVGHAHARYRHARHNGHGFLGGIWISIPGPFGSRISKRL